jgi:hypothetical protein
MFAASLLRAFFYTACKIVLIKLSFRVALPYASNENQPSLSIPFLQKNQKKKKQHPLLGEEAPHKLPLFIGFGRTPPIVPPGIESPLHSIQRLVHRDAPGTRQQADPYGASPASAGPTMDVKNLAFGQPCL